MKNSTVAALFLLVVLNGAPLRAQEHKYPPIGEYLMAAGAETALAKSAAPPNVSDSATIKLLTPSGYKVAHQGTNGFVCIVMRGFAAPTYTPAQLRDLVYHSALRAPICFDPNAARTGMPFYELRHKLGMEGKSPEQIAVGIEAAYAKGELPKRIEVSYAYMWSADQNLGGGGRQVGPAPHSGSEYAPAAIRSGVPFRIVWWCKPRLKPTNASVDGVHRSCHGADGFGPS